MEDFQCAIVLGGNHHNTLGVIRSLGREGVMSSLILYPKSNFDNYILKSKYICDYDVVNDEVAVLEALKKRAKTKKQVIICCSDKTASIVDENHLELESNFVIPGCDGRLTRIMNKAEMFRIAKESGLKVPFTVELDCDNENEILTENIPFPCIVKPLSSMEGAKTDIAVCGDSIELKKHLKKMKSRMALVQSYIDKSVEYQLIGVRAGGVCIPGRSIIITQPDNTNTGFLKYENLDGTEPLAKCETFMEKTGYRGLFSLEFIRDREGVDWFLEINFRNDGNSICVTEAGVNLPYLWYQSQTKLDFEWTHVSKKIREIYVVPEFMEVNLWYAGFIDFGRMIKELKKADVMMEYSPDDPSPTNGMRDFYLLLFLSIIKRPIRKVVNRINATIKK